MNPWKRNACRPILCTLNDTYSPDHGGHFSLYSRGFVLLKHCVGPQISKSPIAHTPSRFCWFHVRVTTQSDWVTPLQPWLLIGYLDCMCMGSGIRHSFGSDADLWSKNRIYSSDRKWKGAMPLLEDHITAQYQAPPYY